MVTCETAEFASGSPATFVCGGGSKFLNQLCIKKDTEYTLTVYYDRPFESVPTKYTGLANKPPESKYCSVINGWKKGWDRGRVYCEADGTWYWVKYPVVIDPAVPFTECSRLVKWLPVMLASALVWKQVKKKEITD